MDENEARETRTYTIPCKRTKETFVLGVDGIIKFGFVAMLLPVGGGVFTGVREIHVGSYM